MANVEEHARGKRVESIVIERRSLPASLLGRPMFEGWEGPYEVPIELIGDLLEDAVGGLLLDGGSTEPC